MPDTQVTPAPSAPPAQQPQAPATRQPTIATQVSPDLSAKLRTAMGLKDKTPPTPPPAAPPVQPAAPAAQPAAPAPAAPATPPAPPADDSMTGDIPAELMPDMLGEPAPAAPVEPAAPAAPASPEGDVDVTKLEPKIGQAMAAMRTKIKALEGELLAARQAKPSVDEAVQRKLSEFDTMAAKLQQAEQHLARFSIEHHPQYKAEFGVPRDNTLAQIKTYLHGFGAPEELAEQAEAMDPKTRIEALRKVNPDLPSYLIPLYAQLDTIRMRRDTMLKNAPQELQRLQEQQAVQVRQFRSQHYNAAVEKALQDGYIVFREVPGNEKWNGMAKGMRALAHEIVQSDDPSVQTAAIVKGVAATFYRDQYRKVLKEVARLQGQLKGVVATAPQNGNGSGGPSGAAASDGKYDKSKGSFAEQMVQQAKQSLSPKK